MVRAVDLAIALVLAVIGVPLLIFAGNVFCKTNCFGVVPVVLLSWCLLRGRLKSWVFVQEQLRNGSGVLVFDSYRSGCFWWNPDPETAQRDRRYALAGAFLTLPPRKYRDLEALGKDFPSAHIEILEPEDSIG